MTAKSLRPWPFSARMDALNGNDFQRELHMPEDHEMDFARNDFARFGFRFIVYLGLAIAAGVGWYFAPSWIGQTACFLAFLFCVWRGFVNLVEAINADRSDEH